MRSSTSSLGRLFRHQISKRPSTQAPSGVKARSGFHSLPYTPHKQLTTPTKMSTGIPRNAADSITETRGFSTATSAGEGVSAGKSFADLGIENTNIKTAAGVNLSESQKVIVGSVLDLFAGRPSLAKLALWSDAATFSDPITKAEGRKQFAAQWYGLQAAFSSIERLGYEVTSAGNPVVLGLKTKYVVKGVGKEQVIESRVSIWTEGERELKIVKVEDAWNGEVPSEGAFAKALRNLNSVVVPAFVSVPKNDKEDAEKGNQ